MQITIPKSREHHLKETLSRKDKKRLHTQQRSARRMAKKLILNTSILKDSTGPSIADQPITTTGWMGVGAHHRDVGEFEKAWERGEPLYPYLKDFRPVPFDWIEV
jgi:hypothetical protein